MSIVGQEEKRGDIWLTLDCGHVVRKELYLAEDSTCSQCSTSEVEADKPARKKRKPKSPKPKYTPYVAGAKRGATEETTDPVKTFWWRGRLRKQ